MKCKIRGGWTDPNKTIAKFILHSIGLELNLKYRQQVRFIELKSREMRSLSQMVKGNLHLLKKDVVTCT